MIHSPLHDSDIIVFIIFVFEERTQHFEKSRLRFVEQEFFIYLWRISGIIQQF